MGVLLKKTHHIDESRQKDDDDGEDAHQGAVQSGLDYPLRQSLQWDWEELRRRTTRGREERMGVMGKKRGRYVVRRGFRYQIHPVRSVDEVWTFCSRLSLVSRQQPVRTGNGWEKNLSRGLTGKLSSQFIIHKHERMK